MSQDEHLDEASADIECAPLPLRPDYYPQPAKLTRELKRAPDIYHELTRANETVYGSFRVGRGFDPAPLMKPVAATVASVIRHPEAMVWMRKMDTGHTYLTGHATRSAVLAAVIGRALGLPERQIERVVQAAALAQIGKTRIPRALLEKTEALTDEEMARILEFVNHGVEILSESDELEPEIALLVQAHQERFDGSGYPNGLVADAIPLGARIAGLVGWYDAATTRKPYTDRVISATDAMDLLYEQRGTLFQGELVEQFIRAMGIYPTGNLVELNTGEVALVEAQNRDHRTQPLVLIVLNERKEELPKYRHVDLLDHNRNGTGRRLTISRALGAGEHGLDAGTIMRKEASQRKRWFFGW